MKGRVVLLLILVILTAGCAPRASPSDREWARAQCDQVVDSDARKKCLERADRL